MLVRESSFTVIAWKHFFHHRHTVAHGKQCKLCKERSRPIKHKYYVRASGDTRGTVFSTVRAPPPRLSDTMAELILKYCRRTIARQSPQAPRGHFSLCRTRRRGSSEACPLTNVLDLSSRARASIQYVDCWYGRAVLAFSSSFLHITNAHFLAAQKVSQKRFARAGRKKDARREISRRGMKRAPLTLSRRASHSGGRRWQDFWFNAPCGGL